MSTITQTLTLITAPIIATSVDALSPAVILAYVESQQTYDSSIANTLIPQMNTIIGQTNIVIGELNTLASGVTTNAGIATTKAGEAFASANLASGYKDAAAASAQTCANFAGAFVSTSTTSVLIGTGSKSFTIQTGEQYTTGAFISIAYTTTPTNFMHGQVTSYNSGTGALVVDVQSVGGSGTFALWSISLSGARGATGATGATFTGGSLTSALNYSRATIASHATTADIWTGGNQIDWTGTATTTAFPNAPQAGAERTLICAGACSFTAGANMLIDGVASGATVTCAANDTVIVRAVSTTIFKLSRIKYDGTAQVSGASGLSSIPQFVANLINTNERFCPYFGWYGGSTYLLDTGSLVVFIPIVVTENITIDALSMRVTANATVSISMAIYSSVSGLPNTLLASTSTISASTIGLKEGVVSNINLIAGNLYFLACLASTSSVLALASTTTANTKILGLNSADNGLTPFGAFTQSSAAFPSTASVTAFAAGGADIPVIMMRKV